MKILIAASNMVHINNFHRPYIEELKKRAAEKENDNIVLRSGDIHKELGLTSRMPTVCAAMRKAMSDGDAILHQTPSGNSSTLLINYSIK